MLSCSPNVFTIYLGNEKSLNLKGLYPRTFNALDLTAATEIDIALPKQDGTFKHYLLSLSEVIVDSPADAGNFHCVILSADSLLLNQGEFQSFNVNFTFPTEPKKITIQYVKALSVFQNP